ncbi:MAG: hypothetical protein JWO59_691 [Chloroflexi bacterium]|nr:hypothetical protein [Chloroflexota bacterium]
MPRYIAHVRGKVALWSSIVDAPLSPFCDSVEELREYVPRDYRCRLDTLEHMDEADTLNCNRAGENEAELTAEELLLRYAKEELTI